MKNFTKIIAIILIAITLVSVLAACSDAQDSKGKKFGIITLLENGAFTDMKQGIIEGLSEAGYVDGETCTIDYQCAGGDTGTLATIVSAMSDGSYDAVFTIATPATQAFVNTASTTPCFFCSVSSPIAAGVMSDLNTPDKNTTGTSNAIPVEDIVDLAIKLTPDIKNIGLISSGQEANATNTVDMVKSVLDSKSIAYTEKTAQTSAEVSTVASALVASGVDAIFVPNDSIIQSGVATLADIAADAGIPVYCSSATTVVSGCLAAVAIDDIQIGKLTASMAVKYLNGEPVSSIPAIVCDINYCSIYVNKATLQKLGLADKLESLGLKIEYIEN